jgi:hypothetical protein
MTPPRDEDGTSDNFATVIPLRRRQLDVETPAVTGTLEPDSRGLWDSNAPIPGLPERSSRSEQPPAPELPARSPQGLDYIDPNAGEAIPRHSSRSRRRLRRRLALAASAAAILAATAAALIVAASWGARPHADHPATSRSASTPGPAVADTRPTRTVTTTHAPSSKPKTGVRSHRAARHRHRPAIHRHAAVSTSTRAGASNAPVGASLSAVSTAQPPSPLGHTKAPVVSSRTPGSGAASSCVPGELGC